MKQRRRCNHTCEDGSTCGAIFEAYPSDHRSHCPDHRRSNGNCKNKADYRIQGTCSVCGGLYACDGKNYRHKRKIGKRTICPRCLFEVQSEKANKNILERKTYQESPKEWIAPCRMKIVPKRAGLESRCKPALAGRCHMVEECVTVTARWNWQGWKVG